MNKINPSPTVKKMLLVALIGAIFAGGIIFYINTNLADFEPLPNLATMCCDKKGGEYFYEHGNIFCRMASGEVINAWIFLRENCLSSREKDLSSFLKELKEQTAIGFSDVYRSTLDWNTNEGTEHLDGKGFEAQAITFREYNSVYSFFQEKGFQSNPYNIAAGTISEVHGYQKNHQVCVIVGGVSGFEKNDGQWSPERMSKRDVEVNCAFLE